MNPRILRVSPALRTVKLEKLCRTEGLTYPFCWFCAPALFWPRFHTVWIIVFFASSLSLSTTDQRQPISCSQWYGSGLMMFKRHVFHLSLRYRRRGSYALSSASSFEQLNIPLIDINDGLVDADENHACNQHTPVMVSCTFFNYMFTTVSVGLVPASFVIQSTSVYSNFSFPKKQLTALVLI